MTHERIDRGSLRLSHFVKTHQPTNPDVTTVAGSLGNTFVERCNQKDLKVQYSGTQHIEIKSMTRAFPWFVKRRSFALSDRDFNTRFYGVPTINRYGIV